MPRGIYDRKKSKPGKSAAKLAKVETKVSAPSKEEIRNVLEQATAEATARLRQQMAVSAPSDAVSFVFSEPVVRVWRLGNEDVVAFIPAHEFDNVYEALAALKIPLIRER